MSVESQGLAQSDGGGRPLRGAPPIVREPIRSEVASPRRLALSVAAAYAVYHRLAERFARPIIADMTNPGNPPREAAV